ncbi:hypothetical protein HZU67_05624 [Apis mellifera carnica]|nr:hypothetical protein HZU67_05624 [Apis mellifera carnica]
MNVFDNQYRTYRTVLKIVGLWPYDNSIYVRIQRICVLIYFLIVVLVQIFSLVKSEISLRNCIVTFSTTFPTLLFCLRYIYCLTLFSYAELLFDNVHTEERLLEDTTEIQIQTKYLDISSHIIDIFCCKKLLYVL